MDIFGIIAMVGGLALFLFGMHEMSAGLEKLSGGTLERTLKKFTSNIFKAVLLGIVVTAIIQSSSATTVLAVGLVNSGLLSLNQAIGIMMGANIGTTITGQITRLIDLDGSAAGPVLQFFSPSTLAPFVAIIGILLIMACKGKRQHIIGQITMGFSILFTGLLSMSESVKPLADSPAFLNALEQLSKYPILGLIAGVVITAIIQSSSASVGMLQALSATGALTFGATYPIILGQNIGTCITSVLSSIGTSCNAKRTAAVHVYFNVIGTILFMILLAIVQMSGLFANLWDATVDSGMIANFHTIFNVATTLLLLPFAKMLEKLAVLTIREKKHPDEDDEEVATGVLDDRFLSTPSLAIKQCTTTVLAMGKLSSKNVRASLKLLREFSEKKNGKIGNREEQIDQMEDQLANYMVKLNDNDMTENDNRQVTFLLRLMPEFERIGDHAENIAALASKLHSTKNCSMTPKAEQEIKLISSAVLEIMELSYRSVLESSLETARAVEPLEETIDMLQEILRERHTERLKSGKCNVDASVIFADILMNLERISDHCSNIALEVIGLYSESSHINRHQYVKQLHEGRSDLYNQTLLEYQNKYLTNVPG